MEEEEQGEVEGEDVPTRVERGGHLTSRRRRWRARGRLRAFPEATHGGQVDVEGGEGAGRRGAGGAG